MPLAVAVPELAAPLLIVAGFVAKAHVAPLPGTVNVTCPPLTGSLSAVLLAVTFTVKGLPKAVLIVVL